MFGFGKIDQGPAGRREDRRALAFDLSGERSAGGARGDPDRSSARCRARCRQRTPARLEAVFRARRVSASRCAEALTAQYIEHGSRSSRVEDQLWQALFDLTQGFLLCYQAFAREVSRPRAERQVASAAAGADRAADHSPRPRRQDPAVSLRAVDSGAVVRAAFAVPDRAARRRSSAQPIAAPADGALTTIEQEYLRVLLLQLMNAGNLSRAPRRVGRRAAVRVVRAAAPERRIVDGDHVLRRPGRPRAGCSAARPQPLEGRVLFPRHAAAARGADAERRHARAEDAQRPAVRPDVAPHRAAQPADQARRAGRSRNSGRCRGAAKRISGVGQRSTRSSVSRRSPAFCTTRRSARLPTAASQPARLRRARWSSRPFGHMRNENARAQEVARRLLGVYAAPGGALGHHATSRRPATGWSRR